MKILLWLISLLFLCRFSYAQDDSAYSTNLTPDLDEVFPMADTPQGVQVTAPVLLNMGTIIPPQATLRVCYLNPRSDDPMVSEIRQEQAGMNSALARQNDVKNYQSTTSPEVVAAIRIATKTVWPGTADFRNAFRMMSAASMHIVYADPKTQALSDEVMDLPQGLLLSEAAGQVVVLAIEMHRGGQSAGILPGDQILSIAGKKLDGTLTSFVSLYQAALQSNDMLGVHKIAILIQRKGEPTPRELNIGLPPSLKGSLMDQ